MRKRLQRLNEDNLVESPAAMLKANCGWLRPCTLGDFLLLVQEKVTKEKDTPERATPSSVPRPTGHSPTRRAHTTRLGLKHGARLTTPGEAVVLGTCYGVGLQNLFGASLDSHREKNKHA